MTGPDQELTPAGLWACPRCSYQNIGPICTHCGASTASAPPSYLLGNLPPLVEPTHVVDRLGDVWRVVRDGGMVTRADYGGIKSAGIEWLRAELGPLIAFDPITYRREHQSEVSDSPEAPAHQADDAIKSASARTVTSDGGPADA